jgi:hypothetical protein
VFWKPTLVLLALILAAVGALVAYDQMSNCDVGPVTRAVKDLLGQTYSTRCAG